MYYVINVLHNDVTTVHVLVHSPPYARNEDVSISFTRNGAITVATTILPSQIQCANYANSS